MKLLFAFACIAVVSADVSHLKKYLPPTAQPEITQKYLPSVAQPEFTHKYLSPIAQPQITKKFVAPVIPSFASYPSTYSSASLHLSPLNVVPTYAATTYSISHVATFHGTPALNPLPSYSNVYSGFDTVYNGHVNSPEYTVQQPIVAQKPIEPANYEPIENSDSTVVSADEYNENNGYTYIRPEDFSN